jgi:hypothetical protein
MRFRIALILALAACASLALANNDDLLDQGRKTPSVSAMPVPVVQISRGKPGKFQIQFRVSNGFHINSNKPKSEYLVPTALKLNLPTDIVIANVTYPAGTDKAFPFLGPNESLNVYSGDFTVAGNVLASQKASAGTYRVHGMLKYQACDNAQCFPPKETPVSFDIHVLKASAYRARRNPPQSPDVH